MEETKEELLKAIEKERQRLNTIVRKGLDDPEVQERSRRLDELIERYLKLEGKVKEEIEKSQG